jgi:hypothetical protein
VVRHAAFITLVVEQDWLGLHSGLAKLPLLQAAGVREGAFGLVLVNKTPHVELLPEPEFARQFGCGVLAALPAAADLLAANQAPEPVVLHRADAAFSECIYEMANRFSADPIRFVRF